MTQQNVFKGHATGVGKGRAGDSRAVKHPCAEQIQCDRQSFRGTDIRAGYKSELAGFSPVTRLENILHCPTRAATKSYTQPTLLKIGSRWRRRD